MVKRFVVYSLPDGTDPDEFWKYHTEEHSEDFKKNVGTKLRKYVMNRVTAQVGQNCKVDVRGKLLDARVVKPPFVREGKACI